MRGKKVLITGAQGFVGRHVAQCFSRNGYTVHGIGHGARMALGKLTDIGLASWVEADITLEALVKHAGRPDVIVHCAGGASVGASLADPHGDFMLTLPAVSAVLEYIRQHSPGTTLIYPSSAAVYGNVTTLPISESAERSPVSPYGLHKVMAEDLCRYYAAAYQLPVAVIRLFSVYGRGLAKQLLWDASCKITRGEREFFGTGRELRDWLHAEDAAQLIRNAVAHADASCPVVNGGSGAAVSVAEVLRLLFAAHGCEGEPMFSGLPRPGDPPGFEAEVASVSAWGWQPSYALEAGVRDYVQWFKMAHT